MCVIPYEHLHVVNVNINTQIAQFQKIDSLKHIKISKQDNLTTCWMPSSLPDDDFNNKISKIFKWMLQNTY